MKLILVFFALFVFSCSGNKEVQTVKDWPRYLDSLDKIWSDRAFNLGIYWYVRKPGDEGADKDPVPLILDYIDSTNFLRYQISYAPHYSYFSRIFYLNDSTWKETHYDIGSVSRWKSRISADTTFRLPNGRRISGGDSLLEHSYLQFIDAASKATFGGISYKYNNIFDVTMDSLSKE